MADLVDIGFRIDSSDIQKAIGLLDQLATKVTAASAVSEAVRKIGESSSEITQLREQVEALTSAMSKMQQSSSGAVSGIDTIGAAMARMNAQVSTAMEGLRKYTEAAIRAGTAGSINLPYIKTPMTPGPSNPNAGEGRAEPSPVFRQMSASVQETSKSLQQVLKELAAVDAASLHGILAQVKALKGGGESLKETWGAASVVTNRVKEIGETAKTSAVQVASSTGLMSDGFKALENAINLATIALVAWLTQKAWKLFVGSVETVNLLQNRLQAVIGSTQEAANAFTQIYEISQKTRTSFEGTGTIFSRLALQVHGAGMELKDIGPIVETIQKSIAISGSTAIEAKQGLLQFAQGLASTRLQGLDLRAVLDEMPRLSKALAEGMGLSVAQLRKFGELGLLIPSVLLTALQTQRAKIDAEFVRMSETIGQAFEKFSNAIMVGVGHFAIDSGFRDLFVSIVEFGRAAIEDNLVPLFKSLAPKIEAALRPIINTIQTVTGSMDKAEKKASVYGGFAPPAQLGMFGPQAKFPELNVKSEELRAFLSQIEKMGSSLLAVLSSVTSAMHDIAIAYGPIVQKNVFPILTETAKVFNAVLHTAGVTIQTISKLLVDAMENSNGDFLVGLATFTGETVTAALREIDKLLLFAGEHAALLQGALAGLYISLILPAQLTALATAFPALLTAVREVALALQIMFSAGIISGIRTLITLISTGLATAVSAFVVAAALNPFTWIAIAIGGFIALRHEIAELITGNRDFGAMMGVIWRDIKGLVGEVVNIGAKVVDWIHNAYDITVEWLSKLEWLHKTLEFISNLKPPPGTSQKDLGYDPENKAEMGGMGSGKGLFGEIKRHFQVSELDAAAAASFAAAQKHTRELRAAMEDLGKTNALSAIARETRAIGEAFAATKPSLEGFMTRMEEIRTIMKARPGANTKEIDKVINEQIAGYKKITEEAKAKLTDLEQFLGKFHTTIEALQEETTALQAGNLEAFNLAEAKIELVRMGIKKTTLELQKFAEELTAAKKDRAFAQAKFEVGQQEEEVAHLSAAIEEGAVSLENWQIAAEMAKAKGQELSDAWLKLADRSRIAKENQKALNDTIEAMKELNVKPLQDLAKGLQDAAVQFKNDFIENGFKAVDSFGDYLKNTLKRLRNELVYQAILQPILNSFVTGAGRIGSGGSRGGGGLSDIFNFGGYSSGGGASASDTIDIRNFGSGGVTGRGGFAFDTDKNYNIGSDRIGGIGGTTGSSVGGGGGLLSSIGSLFQAGQLFGGGGGGGGGLLKNISGLWGGSAAPATGGGGFWMGTQSAANTFGGASAPFAGINNFLETPGIGNMASGFGKFLGLGSGAQGVLGSIGGGVGGMLAGNTGANLLSNAIGIGGNRTNANIGGTIGGIAGAAIGGPLGAAVGSFLGNLAGSLFGPQKATNAAASLAFDPTSGATSNFWQANKGNSADNLKLLQQTFTGMGDVTKQIASLGIEFTETISKINFGVRDPTSFTTKQIETGVEATKTIGGSAGDAQRLATDVLAELLRSAKSNDPRIQAILTAGVGDPQTIISTIELYKQLDQALGTAEEPLSAVTVAIKGLNDIVKQLRSTLTAAGQSTKAADTVLAAGMKAIGDAFKKGLETTILGLESPIAATFDALMKANAQRVADSKALGGVANDLVLKLNTMGIEAFVKGAVSAATSIDELNRAFDVLVAQAQAAGKSTTDITSAFTEVKMALKTATDKGVVDALLRLANPTLAAWSALTKAQEERVRTITALGGNLVAVERLNALERSAFLKNLSKEQASELGVIADEWTNLTDQITFTLTQIHGMWDDVTGSIDDQIKVLLKSKEAYEELAKGIGQSITDLIAKFRPQRPSETLATMRTAFQSTSQLALGGDQAALKNLPKAANDFLDASRAMFASSKDFQDDLAFVLNILDAAKQISEGLAAKSQTDVDFLKDQLEVLAQIKDILRSPDPNTSILGDLLSQVMVQTDEAGKLYDLLRSYVALTATQQGMAPTDLSGLSSSTQQIITSAANPSNDNIVTSVQASGQQTVNAVEGVESAVNQVEKAIQDLIDEIRLDRTFQGFARGA